MLEPDLAIRTHLARDVRQFLIQWKGEPSTSANWEDIDDFIEHYPSFQLEDKLLVEGRRDVVWGRHGRMRYATGETSHRVSRD